MILTIENRVSKTFKEIYITIDEYILLRVGHISCVNFPLSKKQKKIHSLVSKKWNEVSNR